MLLPADAYNRPPLKFLHEQRRHGNCPVPQQSRSSCGTMGEEFPTVTGLLVWRLGYGTRGFELSGGGFRVQLQGSLQVRGGGFLVLGVELKAVEIRFLGAYQSIGVPGFDTLLKNEAL